MPRVRMTLFALILSVALFAAYATFGMPGNAAFAAGSNQASDDHGDTVETATPVSPDSVAGANLESNGDVDFFSFPAEAGQVYVIETALGDLSDSVLTLYDASGIELAYNDDVTEDELASHIEYTATLSETLFIEVRGYFASHTGGYTLIISSAGASIIPQALGTGAFTSSDAAVEILLFAEDFDSCDLDFELVSGPANGFIEFLPDSDQPCVLGSPNQDTLILIYIPDPGFVGDDRFDFVAVDSDLNVSDVATVFIDVGSGGGQIGDDHGDTIETATPVGAESDTSGNLETPGDVDVCRRSAIMGHI